MEIDPRPAPRPQRITLEGRCVRLVPLDASAHGADLWSLTCAPENDALWLYLFDGPYRERAAFDQALAKKAAADDPLFFAILERDGGRAVGYASLMRIEPAHRVIEVGNILYTPALQRTTGATEAMYLLARHVFDDLGYRRYEWKCDSRNEPSRRAALRLGFTFEGIFRQHMIVKGRNRDTAWFSMLDAEWPARRAAFERWLNPANFAAGEQKTALGLLR
jgi:RimJ/RimL family protein N-acetyltransferase